MYLPMVDISIIVSREEKVNRSRPVVHVGQVLICICRVQNSERKLCALQILYNEKEYNDMKVIGFRKSSFKGNDGTEVSGVNLYLTDKCEKGEGLSCDRIYVMDKILATCGYTPKLNDEVIIEYNRWGKCSGIRLAKF